MSRSGRKQRPSLHRRRSSLPNVKIVPLTIAERRLLARKQRQQEAEAVKLAAEKAAEEKRQRAKQLRKATKAKDSSHRRKVTVLGNLHHCRYCDDMIDQYEFDDHKVSHPTHIRERIWLGNAENSQSMADIKKCKITHILNCTKEIDLTKEISKKLKSFKRISIQDKNHETILDYINEANQFIEKALSENSFNVVFVHCREGRSRSVSFLSAYLMWKERQSFHAILSDITSKRHIVLPNNKFYSELEKFEKKVVFDRNKNNFKKFGKPNMSFTVAKVSAYKKTVSAIDSMSTFQFPKAEDLKEDNDYGLSSPPKRGSKNAKSYHQQRRSSMSDIDLSQPLSPYMRSSVKLALGYNDVSSGRLSPVAGSPITKKKKGNVSGVKEDSNGWSEVIYEPNINGSKKKKKSGKNNGSKKKSKKKKGKGKGDLGVEEAMDVTDIFGDSNGAKKKKKSEKSKKKSAKKKSAQNGSKKKKVSGSKKKKKKKSEK